MSSLSPSKLCADFMTEYKEMEQALSGMGQTVLDYEQTLPDSDKRKMQLCRLTRNYLAHEPAGFAVPSEAMIAFVSGIAQKFLRQKAKVCDVMTRVTPLSDSVKIYEAARRITDKRPVIPVIDPDGVFIGLFTKDSVVDAVSLDCLKRALSRHKELLQTCTTMHWRDPASEAPIGCVCAVDEKGKYKGLVFTAPEAAPHKTQ